MCQKPKPESENSEPVVDTAKPRSYYYDDAHGYEDFDPTLNEIEPDDDDESA